MLLYPLSFPLSLSFSLFLLINKLEPISYKKNQMESTLQKSHLKEREKERKKSERKKEREKEREKERRKERKVKKGFNSFSVPLIKICFNQVSFFPNHFFFLSFFPNFFLSFLLSSINFTDYQLFQYYFFYFSL